MKEFIKALFDEKKQIPFRYKDYDNFFCAGEYHSFYLLFFLQSDKELMEVDASVREMNDKPLLVHIVAKNEMSDDVWRKILEGGEGL